MESLNILKTLAEINRLRIINLLLEEELCVCELQEILDLSQVSVSRHLSRMRESKVVETDKRANRVFYSLTQKMKDSEWLNHLISDLRSVEEVLANDFIQLQKHDVVKKSKEYCCPND